MDVNTLELKLTVYNLSAYSYPYAGVQTEKRCHAHNTFAFNCMYSILTKVIVEMNLGSKRKQIVCGDILLYNHAVVTA